MRERATKLEFLEWFYGAADFGPAHGDVITYMKQDFMESTDKNLPEGYNVAEDGETSLDK